MKTCALVIGHKKTSPGARNRNADLAEFAFNEQLVLDIEQQVTGVQVQRVYRRTYPTLPGDINELDPDFIVSFHCNAYDEKTSGTEVLYYHRSSDGKAMAKILQKRLVDALGLRDRGIKPKTSEDRGGYLLQNTKAPCLIAEPFFIDNDADLDVVLRKRKKLVKAYAAGIKEIAKSL